MKIHEYQGKALFRQHDVPVLRGIPCTTAEAAEAAARELGSPVVVVKSQIHAGGRGKGTVFADEACTHHVMDGGVKVVKSPAEARDVAGKLLGNCLRTAQTAGTGKRIGTVYVEDGCAISKELYLSVLLDRAVGAPMVVASADGGMDIEAVAHDTPERVKHLHLDPALGLQDHQARRLGFELGLTPAQVGSFVTAAKALVRCFMATDADMLEVNPLVVTKDDKVVALDCKMSFDDNALFRHPDIAALLDPTEEDPAELEAKKHDMAFVKLGGNIGCMVNGAGLAMATMDAIAQFGSAHGAFPANFLDVGGGATAEKVTTAFKIILKDPSVEAILVNIFGGIMKCDTIASGVLTAVKEVGLDRPLVVRLEGTRVEEGKKLIADSGLPVITATDLKDGCSKAAEAAAAWRLAKGLAARPALPTPPPIAYIPKRSAAKRGPGRPPTVAAPVKRGPGRPPKAATPAKRGPGRPPKAATPAKRGPGRPPKAAAPAKRGPGRPPTAKRGPGRPPKTKRGPGRPPKAAKHSQKKGR